MEVLFYFQVAAAKAVKWSLQPQELVAHLQELKEMAVALVVQVALLLILVAVVAVLVVTPETEVLVDHLVPVRMVPAAVAVVVAQPTQAEDTAGAVSAY